MAPKKTLGLDDIEPGDSLYFDRPSFIQRFSGYAGDDYRGVGIADRQDGELVMIQCGRPGFEVKVMADIVPRYHLISVGRAPDCPCVSEVLAWARDRLVERNHYPLASLVPAFFLSWSRNPGSRPGSAVRRALVVPPVAASGMLLDGIGRLRSGADHRFICSTFVAAAWGRACPAHRPVVALDSPKPGCTTGPLSPLATLVARWFLTPSDLWRATPGHRRFHLETGTNTGAAQAG